LAKILLVLDEALAILQVVGASTTLQAKFREQAANALQHKARGHVADPEPETDAITVSSGYGTRTQHGFVELTVNEVLTQMDPAKAREIGMMLIEAAEAAISDQIVMTLLRDRVGITDPGRLGPILIDLREIRQGVRGTSWPS
jgi:hypothetical protein